jgi:hypothetical protein
MAPEQGEQDTKSVGQETKLSFFLANALCMNFGSCRRLNQGAGCIVSEYPRNVIF